MYADYVTALAQRDNLEITRGRVVERINSWYKYMLKQVENDYEDARRIRAGLDMPEDSMSYKISAAFIEDALKEESKKTDKEKRYEEIRRKAEADYMEKISGDRMNGEYYNE